MNTQQTKSYFLSQPHQPFFLLGIINAICMMLVFLLNYKGIVILKIDALTFHSYALIFTLFSNVFNGFLFTTFPRFNQTQVIEQSFYTTLFFTNIAGSLFFLLGAFFSIYGIVLGMGILLFSHIASVQKLYTIYHKGMAPDKSDSFWILVAQFFGIVGHSLFILSLFVPFVLTFAITLSFFMYAIFLAFSVGQRMIPFFSHSFAPKDTKFIKIVFTLFLAHTLISITELHILLAIIDLLLGSYTLYEFKRWQLHPLQSPPILWVLHLALFWLPTAFFISTLTIVVEMYLDTSLYFLSIHLLALGFLTTVLIGFGTRVILGHSGQAPHADNFTKYIFLFIQLVVVLRVLFSLSVAFSWGFDYFFEITALTWIILFILWGSRYAKTLLVGVQR